MNAILEALCCMRDNGQEAEAKALVTEEFHLRELEKEREKANRLSEELQVRLTELDTLGQEKQGILKTTAQLRKELELLEQDNSRLYQQSAQDRRELSAVKLAAEADKSFHQKLLEAAQEGLNGARLQAAAAERMLSEKLESFAAECSSYEQKLGNCGQQLERMTELRDEAIKQSKVLEDRVESAKEETMGLRAELSQLQALLQKPEHQKAAQGSGHHSGQEVTCGSANDTEAAGPQPARCTSDGEVFPVLDGSSFEDWDWGDLPEWVHREAQKRQWPAPMPAQIHSLAPILQGQNTTLLASTGSGKTVAFLLPIVMRIAAAAGLSPSPVALVVSNTRELSQQTAFEGQKLMQATGRSDLATVCFYGGSSKEEQIRAYKATRPQLVSGVPGRLKDVLQDKALELNRICLLVLDEADKLLVEWGDSDITCIVSQCQRANPSVSLQLVCCSATWSRQAEAMMNTYSRSPPIRIDLTMNGGEELCVRSDITQEVRQVPPDLSWDDSWTWKLERIQAYVLERFNEDATSKILVFVEQRAEVEWIVKGLPNDLRVGGLHGKLDQYKRESMLRRFQRGDLRVLVSTDLVGRGIDVADISHVIMSSIPDVTTYVHRVGRTGRGRGVAGRTMLFYEHQPIKWPHRASRLCDILDRASQEVPQWLRDLA